MKKLALFITILIGLILGAPLACSAQTEAGFDITPLFPAEQASEVSTYFDLRVKPETTTNVGMEIHNTTEYQKEISIQFNTATTNKFGVIDYTQDKVVDSSLKLSIKDLVKGPVSVIIPPKDSRQVSYEVTIPKEAFKGQLLGGFYVEEVYPEERPASQQLIDNTFSYTVAMRLTEDDKKITPNLVLNEINQGVNDYKNTVFANLKNTQPTFISELNLQVKVKDLETQEAIVSFEKADFQMAPNSNFDLPIEYTEQYIPVGSYEMQITAQDGDGNSWRLNKKFQIKKAEVETLKSATLPNWVIISIAVVIVLLLLILLVLLVLLRKKKIPPTA
ncbi:DUF916 and DUF3324 domain-containing protein [Enterococcus sp.]|uniref:DUF916 and DUF3324 domain-containing protein n=1 Tax=Enterococcus sp. TaxID=35783 RepID=UPI003C780822